MHVEGMAQGVSEQFYKLSNAPWQGIGQDGAGGKQSEQRKGRSKWGACPGKVEEVHLEESEPAPQMLTPLEYCIDHVVHFVSYTLAYW